MRYRKNVDCLSTDELHALREALSAMYAASASDPFSFATLASFHGGPPTAFCAHGAPGFFTWHRAYLLAFENALRVMGCEVSLPYWDWSSGPSTGVPSACRSATYVNRSGATVPNPLYSGPRAAGGQTARGLAIDTTSFDDLASGAQTALSATTFTSLQAQMNGVHGMVHGRTGGDMSSVPTASYDPDPHGHKLESSSAADPHGMHRPPAQPGVKERFDLELDITHALLRASGQGEEVALKLIALDANGKELPADRLLLEEIVLEIE